MYHNFAVLRCVGVMLTGLTVRDLGARVITAVNLFLFTAVLGVVVFIQYR